MPANNSHQSRTHSPVYHSIHTFSSNLPATPLESLHLDSDVTCTTAPPGECGTHLTARLSSISACATRTSRNWSKEISPSPSLSASSNSDSVMVSSTLSVGPSTPTEAHAASIVRISAASMLPDSAGQTSRCVTMGVERSWITGRRNSPNPYQFHVLNYSGWVGCMCLHSFNYTLSNFKLDAKYHFISFKTTARNSYMKNYSELVRWVWFANEMLQRTDSLGQTMSKCKCDMCVVEIP